MTLRTSNDKLIEEFARRCRFMLEHHGEVHGASINLPQLGSIDVGPMKIHGSGEGCPSLSVFSLWPPHAKGPIPFFVVDPGGLQEEVCKIPVIEEYIKVLRQRMVLDDLADV